MSEPMYVGEVDPETALKDAKQRLEAFEATAFGQNKMARFRRESPRHPILLALWLVGAGTVVCGIAGVVLATAPLVSSDLARTFSAMPAVAGLPVALVALAVCGAISWAALYGLAVMRAANSPLLPRDLSEHNRLRSDVQRLQAQKEVAKRLTETPPPARLRSASY